MMTKTGVVGVGMQGRHHVRIYSELHKSKLVGVADTDLEKARKYGEKYKTHFFRNYKELYNKVDAVSVTVPTPLHEKVALDFMREGVHCLVEKPISSTLEGAKRMIKTAEENDVKLMIGHVERFNPVVRKLKELLEKGVLGDLILISTRRVGPFVQRIREVGIIIDSGTHDIDIARYLVGKEPINVYSRGGRVIHTKEDYAIIVLDFNEVAASIEVNWFTPHKTRTLVVTGTDAIAYLNYIDQTLEIYSSDQKIVPRIKNEEPLKLELDHFLKCVENDEEPLIDGREGLKVLEIALKAQKSSL